jgi:hypothetical protein
VSLPDQVIMPELKHFEERVTSALPQTLFRSLAAFFSGLLAWRTRMAGPDAIMAASLCFAVLLLFYSMNYRTLAIHISSVSLGLRFGVFHLPIPMDNIQTCRVDDLPVLMKYGGAGIHFMSSLQEVPSFVQLPQASEGGCDIGEAPACPAGILFYAAAPGSDSTHSGAGFSGIIALVGYYSPNPSRSEPTEMSHLSLRPGSDVPGGLTRLMPYNAGLGLLSGKLCGRPGNAAAMVARRLGGWGLVERPLS